MVTSSLRRRVLVLVTIAVAGHLVACGDGSDGPTPGDALEVAPDHIAVFRPEELGSSFTDGMEVVRLASSTPVTITSIKSIGGTQSLGFEGALVAGPQRRIGAIQVLEGFPPSDARLGTLSPAEGFVKTDTARKGYELLLGYTWISAEKDLLAAIEVHYQVEGRQFVQRIPAAIMVCPRGESSQSCVRGHVGGPL